MLDTIKLVTEFHDAMGLDDHTNKTGRPAIPDDAVCMTRVQGMTEEVAELMHAMGNNHSSKILDALTDIQYFLDGTFIAFGLQHRKRGRYAFQKEMYPIAAPSGARQLGISSRLTLKISIFAQACVDNDIEVASKALTELDDHLELGYLYNGLISVREAGFLEVHRSNMSKMGPDGHAIRDASGRVTKPASYSPPDLNAVINKFVLGV